LANEVGSRCNVNIGATGAPTLVGPLGWSFTRTGVGTYDGTCPAVPAQAKSFPVLRGGILVSAAKTVTKVIITAYSPTAGTFSFTLVQSAATAAEAANGDILWFKLEASTA
jgi:hypothetical protein